MNSVSLSLIIILFSHSVLFAQANFYRGKTIRIVIGYLSGDTHDLFARAYARNMGKYIPGNPEIIVQNMPGAGTMIAANHIYNITKPDGLTLGSIAPGLYYAQLTGRKEVQFDAPKRCRHQALARRSTDQNVVRQPPDASTALKIILGKYSSPQKGLRCEI